MGVSAWEPCYWCAVAEKLCTVLCLSVVFPPVGLCRFWVDSRVGQIEGLLAPALGALFKEKVGFLFGWLQ